MAAPGQRAVTAFQIAGREVVEYQRVVLKVPFGQALLEGCLAFDQPVHRRVEFVLVDRTHSEHLAQCGDGALGGEGAGRGQLRLRVDDTGGDQGDGEVADAAALTGEQGVQAELLERANHGGDMAVGQAADAGEGLLGIDQRFTAEDTPHGLDGLVR